MTQRPDCSGASHAGVSWLRSAGFIGSSADLVERYSPHCRYSNVIFQVDHAVVDKFYPVEHDSSSCVLGYYAAVPGLENRILVAEKIENNKSEPSFDTLLQVDKKAQDGIQ
jgi:hypothetical protein